MLRKMKDKIRQFFRKLRYLKTAKYRDLTTKEKWLKFTYFLVRVTMMVAILFYIGAFIFSIAIIFTLLGGFNTAVQVFANTVMGNKTYRKY